MKKHCFIILFLLLSESVLAQTKEADSIARRHAEMMAVFTTPPRVPIHTIGLLVYDGYNTLDAMGPYYILSEIMGVNIFFIAKEKGFVRNQRGMRMWVDTSFRDVKQLDILVIPGGAVETFQQTQDSATLNWIRAIDATTQYTTSVCTGSWILGAAGLLRGKNATTNWYRAGEMMDLYGARFTKARWVKDGKYWTSAGVTAGMDMSLAIIDDLLGRRYTEGVMLDLEYDPQPPYPAGTPEKSEPLVADMMKQMYDLSLLPLIEAEKKKKARKKSIFDSWPALDEFHDIMSSTFHPAEDGDLKPLYAGAKTLADKATQLRRSPIPESFTNPKLPELVQKLEQEARVLQQLVEKKKSPALLMKKLTALHDRFHEIAGACRE